jgi:hypothetical protein
MNKFKKKEFKLFFLEFALENFKPLALFMMFSEFAHSVQYVESSDQCAVFQTIGYFILSHTVRSSYVKNLGKILLIVHLRQYYFNIMNIFL